MHHVDTIFWLVILSIVVASIAWTVTQEEVFREFTEYCGDRHKTATTLFGRKFFYLFTCEYCFSHWVTMGVLALTGFKLLFEDWRGYLIAFFVLPWLANQWMSIYRRLRVGIKKENVIATKIKKEIEPDE
jgi:hypothetical protein